jgi:hypothetical protein
MPGDAVIKLCPLRVRQRQRVGFQAFPDGIQQFRLFRSGEAIYLTSQIAHTPITLARFFRSGKTWRRGGVRPNLERCYDSESAQEAFVAHKKYKNAVNPLCPVAIKAGQLEVHAPEHGIWGVVSCEECEEEFYIGPNVKYGSRVTDVVWAKKLAAVLTEDHKQKRPHANSIEIPD